jgi:hypothetical protein
MLPRPVGGGRDQTLLDRQQVGGGPTALLEGRSATTLTTRSAKNRSASPSSSALPAPARPAPRETKTSGRVKVDACSVSPVGPASRSRPSAANRSSSASIRSVHLEIPGQGPWVSLGAPGCRKRPPPSTPPPASGQAPAGGPVDGIDGQPMPIQIPSIQGRPTSIRPLDPVGHHQMGMQQRIALSGRPVVEPDRQQPLSGHVLDTAMATASAQVSVQVPDRLGPRRCGGLQAPPARSPDRRARRESTRSWSAAATHQRRARHCGHAGGPAAPRSSGRGPRTWPGTPPAMLRPAAPAIRRRRRTTGLGTHRGQTDTPRGRRPAHGCNTPPVPPTAWRCRPPLGCLPPSLARANAPLVHCSPRTITGRA